MHSRPGSGVSFRVPVAPYGSLPSLGTTRLLRREGKFFTMNHNGLSWAFALECAIGPAQSLFQSPSRTYIQFGGPQRRQACAVNCCNMASSIQSANARILEVPVTVQGARSIEGENRRELFTESTKTTLVFEKGAVVGLKASVSVGQNLFLRNDQTGREIMCRVLESRQTGDLSYVDLEFTTYGPDFWDAPSEKIQAVAPASDAKQPEAQSSQSTPAQSPQSSQLDTPSQPFPLDTKLDARQKIDLAVQQLAAAQTKPESAASFSAEKEELLATSEPAPAPPAPELAAMFASNVDNLAPQLAKPASEEDSDSPEPPAATPQQSGAACTPASESPHDHADGDSDLEKDSAQLAALMAIDDRKRARRDAVARAKADAGDSSDSAAQAASETIGATSLPVSGDSQLRPASQAPPLAALSVWINTLGPQKIRMAIGIAAAFLLVSTIGVVWHAWRVSATRASAARGSNLPASAWNGAKQPPPTPSVATHLNTPSSPSASVTPPRTSSGSPGARHEARLADVNDADMRTPSSSREFPSRAESGERHTASGRSSLERRKNASLDASPRPDFVPPKVVSEPQPGFPTWANGIDLDPVVHLDALIDEKGNVTETKVLSGPLVLQREAEKAVGLWIFEPATSNGKPVPTHLVLTVEFQR